MQPWSWAPRIVSARPAAQIATAIVVGAVIVAAVWAAGRAEDILGGHDHSHIVVDEVAGLVVAGAFVPGTWRAVTLAFFLFRLFDVWKPFPAGAVDARVSGGLGVVGDDLIAGVYAGLVTRGLLALF